MRYKPVCFVLSLCAALPAATCRAQMPDDPSHITNFNRIFKQFTGLNGYEDLVMAGDLVHGNEAFDAAQAAGATLTIKRKALADPDVQRALILLRTGLDKPISSPRASFDFSTTLPEYSQTRALARLLSIEQYVLLADGETERAIRNLHDGLRLGQAARVDHILISDLVGIAIDAIAIVQITRHIDQFSEHDCDNLLAVIEEWTASRQQSLIPTMARERDASMKAMEEIRRNPKAANELFPTSNPEDDPEALSLVATMASNRAALGQAIDQARAILNEQYDAIVANSQLPSWQQQEWKEPGGDTLAAKLVQMVMPDYHRILDKYTLDNTNLQLLGVDAAIRKYRWQYDRLPDRLEQLHLETLTIDPFTGKELGYKRTGDTYQLFSAGGYAYDDDGKRVPGQRTPVMPKR